MSETTVAAPVPTPHSPEAVAGPPSRRGRWEALRDSLTTPAEWTVSRVAALAVLALVVAGLAFWLWRPGGLLGGTAPLQAGLAYGSAAEGRFVYRLLGPRQGEGRLRATLQAVYDAHEGAVGDGPLTVVLLRRAADAGPYVTGTPASVSPGPDVVAMAVSGPEGREAVLRPQENAPLQPAPLDW